MSGQEDAALAFWQLHSSTAYGGLTLPVITKAHFRLTKTDSVFPLGDAIEFLKLRLVDALQKGNTLATQDHKSNVSRSVQGDKGTHLAWKVDFNGFDTDVGRSLGHVDLIAKDGCN
jgi:hypothetical protein